MSLFVTCASFYASSLIFLQKTSRKSKKIKKPRRKSKKIKKKQKTQKYLTLRTRSLRVTSSSEKIVFYEFKEVFKTQRRFLFMNKIKKQNIMTRCKKFKTIMQFGRVQTRKHVIIFFLQNFKMLFSPFFLAAYQYSSNFFDCKTLFKTKDNTMSQFFFWTLKWVSWKRDWPHPNEIRAKAKFSIHFTSFLNK